MAFSMMEGLLLHLSAIVGLLLWLQEARRETHIY